MYRQRTVLCREPKLSVLATVLAALTTTATMHAQRPFGEARATLLAAGLQGALGSTIGPDGTLYVTEGAAGRISRVDPRTGQITTFASGLPAAIIGLGGAVDIAFIGNTAYALVTLVGPDLGGSDVVGLYRVDGPESFTVVADIGAFSISNPPMTAFDVPTGLQYALENYRGSFLVTDGHHNRVLRVTPDGEVSEFRRFGNVVPTGLAVLGNTVYVALAGPVPHQPQDGKIVSFWPNAPTMTEVASGAPLVGCRIRPGRQALRALPRRVWRRAGRLSRTAEHRSAAGGECRW